MTLLNRKHTSCSLTLWIFTVFVRWGGCRTTIFCWEAVTDISLQRLLSRNPDGDKGYILQINASIPVQIHDDLSQYPISPGGMKISDREISHYAASIRDMGGMPSQFESKKIAPANLHDKESCVLGLALLQFYVSNGEKIKKMKKILSFNQRAWLELWATCHTEQRRVATFKIKKLFHKNTVNLICGKSMESVRRYRNITLIGKVYQHFHQVCQQKF